MDGERSAALVLVVVVCLLGVWGWGRGRAVRREILRPLRRRRAWRPRSPDDCPCCRGARRPPRGVAPPLVRPWREGAARRGRPRRIDTAGYACPCPPCLYYGITDSAIHALVGDGHHGTTSPIQNFRCQACGTKVTERY